MKFHFYRDLNGNGDGVQNGVKTEIKREAGEVVGVGIKTEVKNEEQFAWDQFMEESSGSSVSSPNPSVSARKSKSDSHALLTATSIPVFFTQVTEYVTSKGSYNFRTLCDKSNGYHLEITKCQIDIDPENGGPCTVARIVIGQDGNAFFQVNNGKKLHEVNILTEEGDLSIKKLHSIYENLTDKWKMCGGIPKNDYDKMTANLSYTPKAYIFVERPRPTVYSKNCLEWFLTQRSNTYRNSRDEVVCRQCGKFRAQLTKSNKANTLTDEQRKSREDASSHYPMNLLSAESRRIRLEKKKVKSKIKVNKLKSQLRKAKKKEEEEKMEETEEEESDSESEMEQT